jgi:hypothetical protein
VLFINLFSVTGISGFIAAFGNGAWKTVTIKQTVELLVEGNDDSKVD